MATFSIEEYQIELRTLEKEVEYLKDELQKKRNDINELTWQLAEQKAANKIDPIIHQELIKIPRYVRSVFGCRL